MGHDNGFTPRARYALVIAKEEAHKMNADAIAPHHLLLALLQGSPAQESSGFLSGLWR